MKKDHVIGFGIGVFTGAIVGGVIALLYAPQSGKETRQFISSSAAILEDNVKDTASGVMGTIMEVPSEINRKRHAVMS